ncbi:uncharacterized protein N7483_001331 [Penicillium malachiteum]|uniref:uncharacterized protein n=1 Tax=Penicillium malachiteum TaxID=1324776 RepID=UPI00254786AD|nr:uncharacterized protein N7483_001331 [Penicillium malachiteum]KAJ5736206.1 hypothetical protein N7483_001331 [Penicillium malachiteum]
MTKRRNRHDSESDCSQRFWTESEASDADSETDISTPESSVSIRKKSLVFPAKKRQRSQGSSTCTSSESENDSGQAVHKRPKKKIRSKKWLEGVRTVQERNYREGIDSSASDTGGGDSSTDPNIESDDISSDSDSDGYADGTKTQITFMKGLWERFCRKQHKANHSSFDLKWKDPQNALRAAGKREFTKFLYWCFRVKHASVEMIPELQAAIYKRDSFARKLDECGKNSRKGLDRLEKLKRNVTNTYSRLLYDLRKHVREEFDSSQAVKDSWSPDGSRLASASDKKTVRIWDPTTGQSILTLKGHSGPVFSIAWSHDGSRLASASFDKTVRIWHLATGKTMSTLKGYWDWVTFITWSQDGKRLALASGSKTITIWDSATGQSVSSFEGHSGLVRSIAWSPDGSRVASASDDKTIRIWDPTTGQRLLTLEGHSDSVILIVWSPDGSRLASASDDKTVRIWDQTAF